MYTYGGSQWTYTNASLDDITLEHDAVGLFYVEYSSSPDQPTTGGPANLESFIPQLDNPRWTGSSEGVLFELVSGSGFTTHINGTYGTD